MRPQMQDCLTPMAEPLANPDRGTIFGIFFSLCSNALLMWAMARIRSSSTPFTLKFLHVEQDFQYECPLPNMAKHP
jgi:hypothetical protein